MLYLYMNPNPHRDRLGNFWKKSRNEDLLMSTINHILSKLGHAVNTAINTTAALHRSHTACRQINDRLEFPFELNMYPYTKEGRAAATAGEACVEGRDENGSSTGDGVTNLPEVSGGV